MPSWFKKVFSTGDGRAPEPAPAPIPASRERILDAMESSINPTKSPTFRSGKTGEWKKYFKDEHRQVFKQVAGDLLVRLGYESNYDW